MKVSVVVCTYDPAMYDHLVEAVESVLGGTHEEVEVAVVVDGDADLHELVLTDYGDRDDVKVHLNESNLGLSASRNVALQHATGEVVAFMDDDAVADPEWIAELVSIYEETDAIAVGGRMAGDWVAGEPEFLPEEFYWLVGVTHRGFADPGEEVRNTFGSNISFRREVLEDLGGFEAGIGRRGGKHLQAEEPELGSRMRAEYGRGVVYHPDAVVYHKVFEWRTRPRWLAGRAFWQGYSKRVVETLVPKEGMGEESAFLRRLLAEFLPGRVRRLVTSPSLVEAKQLVTLCLLTGLVGAGYGYGTLVTGFRR